MTDSPSPERKSLKYAEDLGLDTVYHEAVSARNLLEQKHKELLDHRARRRSVEQYKVDREMEVAERERAANPTMSQAQMDKHLKVAYSNEGDIREARDELSSLAGEIDFVEFEIDRIHQDIKIAVARLHELGGYFQFMAVVKQASEARKSKTTREDGNPW